MDIFYSQNMEDYFLYRNFLNIPKVDGIYVELGAMNGVTYSNTLFFEKKLGYRGLLIEPVPHVFKNLQKNRGEHNFCENYAISDNASKEVYIGTNATAGLLKSMNNIHVQKWHKNSRKFEVKTVRFDTLLHKNNLKYIDFLSVDVEGGEELVLKTMDWNIPVYIICIELDGNNIKKDENCRKILLENKFTFIMRMNNNEFYINEDYFRKNVLFDKTLVEGPVTLENTDTKEHKEYQKRWYDLQFHTKMTEFEYQKK